MSTTWINPFVFAGIETIPGIDEFTVLMLHGGGADGSTSFPDSSASSHTVSANNDVQVDTAYSKFSGSSILFDGSGDYLSIPDTADFDFGTNDFTIDAWIRMTAIDGNVIFSHGNGSIGTNFYFHVNSSGKLAFSTIDNTYICSNTLVANVWYHVALARSGATLKMFVDGTQYYSGTHTNNLTSTDQIGIGVRTQGSGTAATTFYYSGHIDELRVSKGIARWTSGFTPPALPYG